MPDEHDDVEALDAKALKGSVTEAIGKIIADPKTVARGAKQKHEGRADQARPSTEPTVPPAKDA